VFIASRLGQQDAQLADHAAGRINCPFSLEFAAPDDGAAAAPPAAAAAAASTSSAAGSAAAADGDDHEEDGDDHGDDSEHVQAPAAPDAPPAAANSKPQLSQLNPLVTVRAKGTRCHWRCCCGFDAAARVACLCVCRARAHRAHALPCTCCAAADVAAAPKRQASAARHSLSGCYSTELADAQAGAGALPARPAGPPGVVRESLRKHQSFIAATTAAGSTAGVLGIRTATAGRAPAQWRQQQQGVAARAAAADTGTAAGSTGVRLLADVFKNRWMQVSVVLTHMHHCVRWSCIWTSPCHRQANHHARRD
jgi:hypothetical protein